MCYLKTVLPLLLAFPASVEAGEFINLDFDSPELGGRMVPIFPGGPELGLSRHLLNGWTLIANGVREENATYSHWNQTSGNTVVTLREGAPGSSFGNYLQFASFVANDGTTGPDLWLKSGLRLLFVFSASVEAGEFFNLGFDEPELSGRLIPLAVGGPFVGKAEELLPGWKLIADGKIVSEATYSLRNQSTVGILDIHEAEPRSPFGYHLAVH